MDPEIIYSACHYNSHQEGFLERLQVDVHHDRFDREMVNLSILADGTELTLDSSRIERIGHTLELVVAAVCLSENSEVTGPEQPGF